MKKEALVVIDVQKAFDDPSWGKRNNPDAESNISSILSAWRESKMPVIHVRHSSVEPHSLFHPNQTGYEFKEEAQPISGESIFKKSVNSAFIGTGLEKYLRQQKITNIVIVGLTTDHCVSTTTRMAGNLGFDVTLVSDATATFNRKSYAGVQYCADDIHNINLTSLDGEFCRVRSTEWVLKSMDIHQGGFMASGSLYRFSAFSSTPEGGNPAGVWIGDALPAPEVMQQIAAEVGFSETAFVAPASGQNRTVRYYSPEAEVSFCGHATIASGVVLGKVAGDGTYRLATAVGEVPVTVRTQDGIREASLTSVEPTYTRAPESLVSEALSALGWKSGSLDGSIPPARAYAGAWHLVLAVADADRLARLDYDFDRLKALMLRDGLTTLQLVWRERPDVFHSRNPFPVGGVIEDPATGAAAAAFGGYLREAGLIDVPATILIRQGEAMGRPSRLTVQIPATGGIVVTGTAVPIEME